MNAFTVAGPIGSPRPETDHPFSPPSSVDECGFSDRKVEMKGFGGDLL